MGFLSQECRKWCLVSTWAHMPYGVALPVVEFLFHHSEELGTLLRLLLPERQAQVEDFIVCKRKVQVGKLPSWELPVT